MNFLRRPRSPLYGLIIAYFATGTGTAMSAVAIPWLVLITTGSAAATGIVGCAQMLPYVVVQAVGGPVADRVGLRRTSLIGNGFAAVAMCTIPVLHAVGALNLGVLAAAAAIAGTARGLADCATAPLLPATAALGSVPNERAAGLYSAASRIALLAGLPLAGVLVSVVGASPVVLVDALLFAAAVIILAVLLPASCERADRPVGSISLRDYVSDIAEGFLYLRADRLLLGIAAMATATNLFDEALTSVLLPVWAHDRVHRAFAIGLVGGALGLGLLGGVMAGAWLGPRLPRRPLYAAGSLIAGAPPFFALAVWASVLPVLPLMVICGVAGGMLNPINGAVQFERVPPQLQARVLGAVKASAYLGVPFGALLGGLLTDRAGLSTALVACGAMMVLATLPPFVFPAWRELDRQPISLNAGSPSR